MVWFWFDHQWLTTYPLIIYSSRSNSPALSCLIRCIYYCPSIDSLTLYLRLYLSISPCLLMVYLSPSHLVRCCAASFFWHFSLAPPHLSFTSLSPSLHHSMLNWDELTFLRNNAITSMAASHYACMSVCQCVCLGVCVCVCVRRTATARTQSHRLFLGENTDAAFCFCSCFRLQFVLLMLW